MTLPAQIEAALRRLGIARVTDLQAATGVSQATVSRALAALGERIVRIGRARASRYALVAPVGNHGYRWPLFAIDDGGRAVELGRFTSLIGDRYLFEPAAHEATSASRAPQSVLMEGGVDAGLFPGLPWYLDDSRPQGFLGRLFARRHAARYGAPLEPHLWRNDHVLAALLVDGDDVPGDLVLGERMLERLHSAQMSGVDAIDENDRATRYATLATAVLAGDVVGSSAGGEQPKFACPVRRPDGVHHVLVKFTEGSRSATKRRWMDLLLAEHHAGEALHADGIAAARSNIVLGTERLFLEVPRFDRIGAHGRRGFVTLAAIDHALYGASDDWRRAATRLVSDRWISAEDGARLVLLHWFGTLIANTDMHFGNVSLARASVRPLVLAPAYDMLPMLYRPAATGELVERTFTPALPPPSDRETWQRAARVAVDCWHRISADVRVSEPFRRIAGDNAERVGAARERVA